MARRTSWVLAVRGRLVQPKHPSLAGAQEAVDLWRFNRPILLLSQPNRRVISLVSVRRATFMSNPTIQSVMVHGSVWVQSSLGLASSGIMILSPNHCNPDRRASPNK